MRFYLYERIERIRKQLRPKTCWDLRYALALYGFICVRYVVHVFNRRYIPWMARYDVLTVSSNILRINFLEEVCLFGLMMSGIILDLLVGLSDPKLTFWAYMSSMHSQHVDNYRATKVDTDKFSDARFQSLLRQQHLLAPSSRKLVWADKHLPQLFDHRRLTVAADRHRSTFFRLFTLRHRYHSILVAHSTELVYYIALNMFYVLAVFLFSGTLWLQCQFFPLAFVPLIVLDDCLLGLMALLLVRVAFAIFIIIFQACAQLRVYFHLLRHLMVKQMRRTRLGVFDQWTFRLYDVEYNKTLGLLMRVDQEMARDVALTLIVIHLHILIVHSNLIFFEPNMHTAMKIYILVATLIQISITVASMMIVIPTSEAAYAMTNMLPTLQLRLQPQTKLTRMKLRVMKCFETMNCPVAKRATISVGSIDRISRFSMAQFILSLANIFLMISRLLIEERQNWIYE